MPHKIIAKYPHYSADSDGHYKVLTKEQAGPCIILDTDTLIPKRISITDTGNGVRVTLGKNNIKLDYAELEELKVLFKLQDHMDEKQLFDLYEVEEKKL